MKLTILILICSALMACASTGAAFQFYVVTKPGENERFFAAISSIAKQEGLETASGHTQFDDGGVLRTVEGRGHRLMLWIQNIVQGGSAETGLSRLCGVHHDPYPDPLEFTVFTEARLFGSKQAAIELGERVFTKLQQAGFEVLRKPVICGAAVNQR